MSNYEEYDDSVFDSEEEPYEDKDGFDDDEDEYDDYEEDSVSSYGDKEDE